MWETYVHDIHRRPTDLDRSRIEGFIQGKFPETYWKLVCEHQGNTLEATLEIHNQGEVDFGVLLVVNSLDDGDENHSYCVESCLKNMCGYYPDGILPFADDTGGNYWAFDFRENPDMPTIVFIDHETPGEEGIIHVSDSFDSFMAKLTK